MKEGPIKVCNDYFIRDNVNFSVIPNEIDLNFITSILNPIIEKFNPLIEEFLEQHGLDRKLNELDESSTIFEIIVFFGNLIINALKDKSMREFLLEVIKSILDNFENFALSVNLFDKELYFNLKGYLEQAIKKNPMKTAEIIIKYFESIQTKFPIERIINNITIIRDQYKRFSKVSEKTTFGDIMKEIEQNEHNLEKIVIGSDKKSIENYFYDFLYRFGSIIEGYIKNSILTIGKLQNFIEEKDSSYLNKDDLMIGNIFSNLRLINEKIDILRNYRNSISHFNFKIVVDEDKKENIIIFMDKGVEISISVEELILDWVKTVQFVNTFNILMSFGIILIKNQEEDVYSSLYIQLKKELEDAQEDLNKLPELSINDLKKDF